MGVGTRTMTEPRTGQSMGTSQPVRVERLLGVQARFGPDLERAAQALEAMIRDFVQLAPARSAVTERAIEKKLLRSDAACLVAWEGNQPIGFALLAPGECEIGETVWWLEAMYVRPGHHEAARALQEECVELGEATRLPVLFMRRRRGRETVRGIRTEAVVYSLERR